MSSRTMPRRASRFLHGMVVVMTGLFGAGTVLSNAVALLAPPEVRAQMGDVPDALLAFDALMGVGYLAVTWGIARHRPWAMPAAWVLAVLHAFGATVVWLSFFYGVPVAGRSLVLTLVREGYWVAIALYLWRAQQGPTANPPASRKGRQ